MIIFFDQNVKLKGSFYVHYLFLSTYGGELYFTVIYEHAAFGFSLGQPPSVMGDERGGPLVGAFL